MAFLFSQTLFLVVLLNRTSVKPPCSLLLIHFSSNQQWNVKEFGMLSAAEKEFNLYHKFG